MKIRKDNKNANTAEYWDHRWSTESRGYHSWTVNRMFYHVPDGSSVLDVGSGQAKLLSRLKNEKGCSVYALDISPVAIERASKMGIDGEVYDAENLDLFDEEFDVVVSSHLLEHIENDKQLVENIARITKNIAILAVPDDVIVIDDVGEHLRNYDNESFQELLNPHFSQIHNISLKNHIIYKCIV